MDFWEGVGQLLKGYFAKPGVSSPSEHVLQQVLEQKYLNAKKAFEQSDLAVVKAYDFAVYVVGSAIDYVQEQSSFDLENIPKPIVEQLLDITVDEIKANGLFDFPFIDFSKPIPLSKQIEIRNLIDTLDIRQYDSDELLGLFQSSQSHALAQFLLSSESLIHHGIEEGTFSTSVLSFQKNLAFHIEQMIISFFSEANAEYGLFSTLRSQLLRNADVASGFRPDRTAEERDKKSCILPSDSKLAPHEIVRSYLDNTALQSLYSADVPFSIPMKARLEHTHIIGGTGHGKTQLIQRLILDDLEAGRGFMVIDSQGDMLQKILMRKQFEPGVEGSLSDRLIYINPEQIDFPAALNIFSLNAISDDVTGLDKQVLINSAVDMYQYIFATLFGAELTAKQGIIFRYIAKLMAEIPDATIHTLRALLENARPYKPYMEQLEGSAKDFFENQFFSSSFNQTKQQVLQRLWMVLSNQSLENLFSSKDNAVDLFEALNEGKIVLVNTSKRLLQDYGSATLGRFFIALLSQAVLQRASVPESLREPYMVYVDEAQEYIDEKLETMLNQARKYMVGFTLSHQNLNQLGSHKHTVFSSTTVKLAGGISAKDAKDLAYEMKCSSDFLVSMQKTDLQSQYACFIKNQLPTAIPISYAFGQLEQAPMISKEGYLQNNINNRKKYCVHSHELSYSDPVLDVYKQKQEEKVAAKKQTKIDKEKQSNKVNASEQKVAKESLVKQSNNTPESADKVQEKYNKDRDFSLQTKKVSETKTTPQSVKPEVVDVPPEGKGGITHRHLQNLIKRIGQQRGFHTVIESPVFDGLGSVDVSLEGFERKIAIEVTVTTGSDWESSNIMKCFSADYDTVIIVASEKDHLSSIRNKLDKEFQSQVKKQSLLFFLPTDLTQYLDEIKATSASTEQRISGYKVETTFVVSDERETKLREEALAKILLDTGKKNDAV